MSQKVWALIVGPEDVAQRDGKTTGRTPEIDRDMEHADMVVFVVNDDVVTWIKKPRLAKPTAQAVATQRFAELETTIEGEPKKSKVIMTTTEPVAQAPSFVMTWRRFEYIGGTSRKFWEISLAGGKYVTRWGRIGTDGSVTVKDWSSEYEARTEYQKIIGSKMAKGYREVK